MDMFNFRRRNARKHYNTNISFTHKGQLYPGTLKDISLGGCFIITSWVNNFSPGDIILVNIPYLAKKKEVQKKGQVSWLNNEGLGIEFD